MEIFGKAQPALATIIEAFKNRFHKVEIGSEASFEAGMKDNQICLAQQLDPIELTERLITYQYKNLIQKNEDSFLADMETAASLIENPENYFSTGGKGILSQVKSAKMFLADVTTNKGQFFRTISDFFDNEEISENSKISAITILGEFYNNAMIDAPEEFAKAFAQESIPSEKKRVSISIEVNQDKMSISCMDLFGMLKPYSFIERLNTVLKTDIRSAMNHNNKKRAGIGCHLIFDNCDYLIMGTCEKEKTVVTAVLPIRMSNKNRALRFKSIQVISLSKKESKC